MKKLVVCVGILLTIFGVGTMSLGCGDGGACSLPPKCGEAPRGNACGCLDGQPFELNDGSYVCKNGCLVPGGGGGGAGGMSSTGGSGGVGGAGGAGGSCMNVAVGQVCVRGELDAQNNQEVLTANGVVRFQLTPEGCLSSSCTKIHEASCMVMPAAPGGFDLTGTFCLENVGGQQGCTPDCSGGGFASCEINGVAAGSYTASINGLMLSFEVPSALPLGGMCVGSPF